MPVSRRQFLAATAGATYAAIGCNGGSDGDRQAARHDSLPWVKDPNPFVQHPTNLETRLEDLTGFLTPNELFFVRNHAPTPRVDVDTYRLRVEGDAVREPVELTYDQLVGLPSATTVSYLECAGNWRNFFAELVGRPASGGQWGRGGVGCASWSGVQLGHVLDLAGVEDTAVDVNLFGLDDGGFNRPMPIDKAADSDTLLALTMNGAQLPPDHGYPVRAVVPGWPGSNSIKWVSRIVVSSSRQWVRNNTTSYVLIGDDWPAEQYAPADGMPITALNVKSTLALPRPAHLAAGFHRIRGFAYSPNGPVQSVDWRVNDGGWRPARIVGPVLRRAWQRFEFEWEAQAGSHVLRTRATDAAGLRQPETVAFNEKGYLMNAILPHPVDVA